LNLLVLEKSILIALLLVAHTISAFSQQAKTVRFTSRYTSFPDSGRSNGHTYDSVFYSTRDHYSDSSVLLVVPDNLRRKNKVDLIFWFHGWNNNIDTANQFYELEKQFLSSRRNTILVLSETAKNVPDSYGGKLEQPGDFSRLVSDVLYHLKKEHLVENKAVAGSITLAGHSGAYRVIAYILSNGGAPVEEVYLFDALYSQVDKFLSWIQQNKGYRFVNWYTNHGGGTDEVSIQMMQQLDQLHLPYKLVEETTINSNDIKSNRILFVHSPREHNVIINRPDDLRLLLENDEGVKQ
ncbi:MAG: hypothetical protein ACXVBF_05915, partial [Flavisolibacter sp.]